MSTPPERAERRIALRAEAAALAARWTAAGERVVLANGVFDLLHVGHARYLRGARALGERLIVAINGDRSTAALKGAGRPVLPEGDRARTVAALRVVDLVVVFGEPDVEALLAEIRPAFHAKGTDYTAGTVPERGASAALGIATAIAGDEKAHASRQLVERIRASHGRTP